MQKFGLIGYQPHFMRFCDFIWLPWQRPLSDCQMNAKFPYPKYVALSARLPSGLNKTRNAGKA